MNFWTDVAALAVRHLGSEHETNAGLSVRISKIYRTFTLLNIDQPVIEIHTVSRYYIFVSNTCLCKQYGQVNTEILRLVTIISMVLPKVLVYMTPQCHAYNVKCMVCCVLY